MFTGLVEGIGIVKALERRGEDLRLLLTPEFVWEGIRLGESIAVSGVCLTATSLAGGSFSVDVSAETLFRTNLKALSPGRKVNLERALRMGDRLGGHLVTGHVDTVGTILSRTPFGESMRFKISLENQWIPLVVEKGSITLDGVSLTVNAVDPKGIEVNLIPHTLKQTTLASWKSGDRVNVETDLIGKYVWNLLKFYTQGKETGKSPQGITLEKLAGLGFLK